MHIYTLYMYITLLTPMLIPVLNTQVSVSYIESDYLMPIGRYRRVKSCDVQSLDF